MTVSAREDKSIYLRAWGETFHHSLQLTSADAPGLGHVAWRAQSEEALELEWTETGGPPTRPPTSQGFGLTIVRSSIESQFRGSVKYDWQPTGLHCRLAIPHAQIVAPEEASAPVPRARAARRPAGSLAGKRLLMVEDEFLIGLMASAAFGIFPLVLPAVNVSYSLTIQNASGSLYGQTVGLVWWSFGMLLAVTYFVITYRLFWGKISLSALKELG